MIYQQLQDLLNDAKEAHRLKDDEVEYNALSKLVAKVWERQKQLRPEAEPQEQGRDVR